MDLVAFLPDSNGYMAIVVMHKLAKMVHLAYCKEEVLVMEYAKLFVYHVF